MARRRGHWKESEEVRGQRLSDLPRTHVVTAEEKRQSKDPLVHHSIPEVRLTEPGRAEELATLFTTWNAAVRTAYKTLHAMRLPDLERATWQMRELVEGERPQTPVCSSRIVRTAPTKEHPWGEAAYDGNGHAIHQLGAPRGFSAKKVVREMFESGEQALQRTWQAHQARTRRYNASKSSYWTNQTVLGKPMEAAEKKVAKWLDGIGHHLDSTLLRNAVAHGRRTVMSFDHAKRRNRTSAKASCFGLVRDGTYHEASHDEIRLSRNSSITIGGVRSRRGGNPKISVDWANRRVRFAMGDHPFVFDFSHVRFSKAAESAYARLFQLADDRRIPIQMTLTRTDEPTVLSLTFSFSQTEFNQLTKSFPFRKGNLVASVYATDEAIVHCVVDRDTGRTVHQRIHLLERLLRLPGNWRDHGGNISSLLDDPKMGQRVRTAVSDALSDVFRTSSRLHVAHLSVERPVSRSHGRFNARLIEFDKASVDDARTRNCMVPAREFVEMVAEKCHRAGIQLHRANGDFLQTISVLQSETTREAILTAARRLALLPFGNRTSPLTSVVGEVDDRLCRSRQSGCGSMIDSAAHLLRHGHHFQARKSLGRAVRTMAANQAARLPNWTPSAGSGRGNSGSQDPTSSGKPRNPPPRPDGTTVDRRTDERQTRVCERAGNPVPCSPTMEPLALKDVTPPPRRGDGRPPRPDHKAGPTPWARDIHVCRSAAEGSGHQLHGAWPNPSS